MFLSAAHRPADIDEALQAASHGFKAVRELEARSDR
jgi:glutamate-1-semialdehyde 2,1-aminomutase